ncbi:MAG: ribbon-helix-helix protein, CopG family [Caldimonas sp.]
MTLTVRLDDTLTHALELHCAERGVSKSLVVQESLARYLIEQRSSAPAAGRAGAKKPSANYLAFERAGLIGAAEGDGRSATKEVVRERVRQRLARKPG